MDGHGRRNRRGRHSHQFVPIPNPQLPETRQHEAPLRNKSWSNSLCNVMIMACLLSVVYLMLNYHCQTCAARCNLHNITKNIESIADNLAVMKSNYQDLETKVSSFSQELPKLEGQLEILEILARPTKYSYVGWDPKSSFCPPNVDVYLNQCTGLQNKTNSTGVYSGQCLKCPRSTVKQS